MPRVVVFKTPGHIPLEAFTTFGINSKPNSLNPIGFFGSGAQVRGKRSAAGRD